MFSDVTGGTRGNSERMAILFDSRKLEFCGLAGEVVIPPEVETIVGADGRRSRVLRPSQQLARTPYLVGFDAGWFHFALCTVHIIYGNDRPDVPERVAEIRAVTEFLASRVEAGRDPWVRNMILLGDFNIFSPDSQAFTELTKAGFVVPEALQSLPTNVARVGRHYDQIAFRSTDRLALRSEGSAGVVDIFSVVYTDADEPEYVDAMGPGYERSRKGETRDERGRSRYYRTWRSYQISDHLPMWVELNVTAAVEPLLCESRSVNDSCQEGVAIHKIARARLSADQPGKNMNASASCPTHGRMKIPGRYEND